MKILLPTQPQLLRNHFRRARLGLIGLKVSKKPLFAVKRGNDKTKTQQKSVKKSFVRQFLSYLLLFISIFSVLVAGVIFIPEWYYQIFPADVKPVESLEAGSTWGGHFKNVEENEEQENHEENTVAATPAAELINLPPKNENLPEGQWLIIPRIGVRTEIRVTADPEEALQKGVWLAPEYGRPEQLDELGEKTLPLIMAAHRYGWQWWWKDDYWRYHSFYKLPELEPGDLVEIIAEQRKWTYEIFAGEEGEEITNYEADLILYTCKFLSSPLRHFRYARLINLEENTQEALQEATWEELEAAWGWQSKRGLG